MCCCCGRKEGHSSLRLHRPKGPQTALCLRKVGFLVFKLAFRILNQTGNRQVPPPLTLKEGEKAIWTWLYENPTQKFDGISTKVRDRSVGNAAL